MKTLKKWTRNVIGSLFAGVAAVSFGAAFAATGVLTVGCLFLAAAAFGGLAVATME
jgi:hypothetical protein